MKVMGSFKSVQHVMLIRASVDEAPEASSCLGVRVDISVLVIHGSSNVDIQMCAVDAITFPTIVPVI